MIFMSDTSQGDPFDWIRRPEYTGANRCMPCTITNLIIAVVISGFLGIYSLPVGVSLFVVFLGMIYLRGYLIPYTPVLTKQYFPESLLRFFDKQQTENLDSESGLVDVENTLREMGIIEPCESSDDICLNETFEQRWKHRMRNLQQDKSRKEAIASLLEVSEEKTSTRTFGSAVVVHFENQQVGQWESEPALSADIAANEELSESYSTWDAVDPINRGRILSSLRMFLEECPACGGPAKLQQETVESCCRSMEVAAVSCDNCDSRLFELELDESVRK
jgi:hypothetical protein